MRGYCKLSGNLINSSVWDEPDSVRIVWITLLAMSDASGFVQSSLPGLAHQCRKTREETISALQVLEAPDPDSQNPDHEGRRIAKIEGGWLIFNYILHRAQQQLSDDPETVASRERMRKFRERKRKEKEDVTSVTVTQPSVTGVSSASASASASASKEEVQEKPNLVPTAEDIYRAYPRHESKPDAISAITKAIRKGFGPSFLLERAMAYAKTQSPRSRFTPLPATWFNSERFNDDPAEWVRLERNTDPNKRPSRQSEAERWYEKKYGTGTD